jgi:hypothetical protein
MRRRLWPLAALATVALIGAGCSNGSAENGNTGTATASSSGTNSSTGTASSTSSGADKKLTARDKAVKFAECIRAHGVSDFPDPDPKNQFQYGISVSPAVWTKAVSACKDLQPPGTLSGKRSPRQQSTALKFAQCMRDNGVKDFPDPANGDPLIDTTKIPSLGERSPRTDPVFAPAMDKCRAVLAAALRDQK